MYPTRISTLLPVLLVVLSILPILVRGSHVRKWEDLDRSKDMEDTFGNGTHSFNVSTSWSICMRRVYDVPYDPEIADYAPVISEFLRYLHKFGGGSVRLEKGTYPLSSGIDMPSHTCIIGKGPLKTTLELSASAPSFYPKKGIIRSQDSERITLQGLTISGNKNKQTTTEMSKDGRVGVYFIHTNYVWLRNVISRDNLAHGFDLRGSDWRWSFYLILEGCQASNNGGNGVRFHQVFYAGMSNALVRDNGGNGTIIESGSIHTLLQRNQFERNGRSPERGCGIAITSDHLVTLDVRLVDNHEVNSPRAGICVYNSQIVSIEMNNVTNVVDRKSFCYDVFNTSILSVLDGSMCVVRTKKTFHPGSTAALPRPPPVVEGVPLPAQNATDGCAGGIAHRDICCPPDCGECGGVGCGVRLSDARCCYDEIKERGKKCGSPPCVLV